MRVLTWVMAGPALLACSLAGVARGALSQVIYETGFETPTFTPGALLNGTDGFVVAPPFLSPSAAVVTTTNQHAGAQAIRVAGASMINAVEVTPYAAVGSYRKPVNYDTTASGLNIVRVEGEVRLDGAKSTKPDFFAANIAAIANGGNTLGEISLSSDGAIYIYSGDFTTPAGPAALAQFGKYYHLTMLVDFATDITTFQVDGVTVGSLPFPAGTTTNTLARASLVTYAYPDAGTDLRANYAAMYDNLSIVALPEPATLSLGLLATPLLLRRRQV